MNDQPVAVTGQINQVVVKGNGATPTHITITAGAAGVKVQTDQKLTDDSAPGWGRYKAAEDTIAGLSINGVTKTIPGAHKTKIKVDVS